MERSIYGVCVQKPGICLKSDAQCWHVPLLVTALGRRDHGSGSISCCHYTSCTPLPMFYRSPSSFFQCHQAAEYCVYRLKGSLPKESCQLEQAPLLWLKRSASYLEEQSPFPCIFPAHTACNCLTKNVDGKIYIECRKVVACSLQGVQIGKSTFKLRVLKLFNVLASAAGKAKGRCPTIKWNIWKRVFYLS